MQEYLLKTLTKSFTQPLVLLSDARGNPKKRLMFG